jgi:hypothetical protein
MNKHEGSKFDDYVETEVLEPKVNMPAALLEAVRVLIEVSKEEWAWKDELSVETHQDLTSLYTARRDLRDALHVVEEIYKWSIKCN